MIKNFLTQIFYDPKKILKQDFLLNQTTFSIKNIYLTKNSFWPKHLFLTWNLLTPKKMLTKNVVKPLTQKNVDLKIFWQENISSKKIFWTQNVFEHVFEPIKIIRQKNWPNKFFQLQRNCWPQKFFFQKIFLPKQFLIQKFFWTQNNFLTQKMFDHKISLDLTNFFDQKFKFNRNFFWTITPKKSK